MPPFVDNDGEIDLPRHPDEPGLNLRQPTSRRSRRSSYIIQPFISPAHYARDHYLDVKFIDLYHQVAGIHHPSAISPTQNISPNIPLP